MFVVASVKQTFFLTMLQYFGKVESMIVVPSYPQTKAIGNRRALIGTRVLFGDEDTNTAVANFKPDIIYSDSPLYGGQLKIAQYAKRKRIPVVVHLRGDLWRETLEWVRMSSLKSKLLGAPVYACSMLGLTVADKITPICKWLEGEVHRHLPSKPTEVVYQGVDPSEFFPDPGFEVKHPAVAIIQNHTVYEKTSALLRFRRVIEKSPNVNFYITTGENVRQRYFPLVKDSLGRCNNVHFLDGISHPVGVRRLLTESDLYVLATGLDCCPTTILQASLMERPVLGSRLGGVPEIIRDGYTGWSIDNRDSAKWVDRIQVLVEDRKLSNKLGQQGRKWVSENFGWATIAPKVEQLIIREVEGSSRRHEY
jgi:glycosyltransferase involved in cell wall biosynthesis